MPNDNRRRRTVTIYDETYNVTADSNPYTGQFYIRPTSELFSSYQAHIEHHLNQLAASKKVSFKVGDKIKYTNGDVYQVLETRDKQY